MIVQSYLTLSSILSLSLSSLAKERERIVLFQLDSNISLIFKLNLKINFYFLDYLF